MKLKTLLFAASIAITPAALCTSRAEATISSAQSSVTLSGNGSTTAFSYPFIIPYQANGSTPAVSVFLTNTTTLVQTPLSPTQYAISGINNPNGGTVTYNPSSGPLPAGNTITISRALAYTQPTAVSNVSFYPHTVEQVADYITMQVQQLSAQVFNSTLFSGPVLSFNARTGAVSLLGGDLTALDGVQYLPVPSGGDDGPAIQSEVNALAASGGNVSFFPQSYTINTAPIVGTKSMFWDISPGTTFTGSALGTWPRMATNSLEAPAGPYWLCQSDYQTPVLDGNYGGLGCVNAEFIQPGNYAGYSVGGYLAAQSASTATTSGIEGLNTLINMEAGFAGGGQSIEADVNDYSGQAATGIAFDANGVGTTNPLAAFYADRVTGGGYWQAGVDLNHVNAGVVMQGAASGLLVGITAGNPSSGLAGDIVVKQLTNGGVIEYAQRITDTSPTGYFIYDLNAAANASLFSVDVSGNVLTGGSITTTTGLNVLAGGASITGATGIAGALNASTSVSAGTFSRRGLVLYANLATVDPTPQVGDMLTITDASACTANVAVTSGSGTGHSCPVVYTTGWIAEVTH